MNGILIWRITAAALAVLSFGGAADGATITLSGTITQSTADTSVPAVQNATLNSIADGDVYTALLSFGAAVEAPGMYNLIGLSFTDAMTGAAESAFLSGSLTMAQTGGSDEFSVLGCLADCALGNEIELEFTLPAAELNSNGAATEIPGLPPLDLLEDGGSTDIQGTVQSYSYQGSTSGIPEPGALCLAGISLVAFGAARRKLAPRGNSATYN